MGEESIGNKTAYQSLKEEGQVSISPLFERCQFQLLVSNFPAKLVDVKRITGQVSSQSPICMQ